MPYKDPEVAKQHRREYYLRNRDAILARTAEYRKKNPEKYRAAIKKWEVEHPDKVRESSRRNYHKDLETSRAKARAYYHAHKEESAAYYQENKERIKARVKQRRQATLEESRSRQRRYAAEHRQDALRRAREWARANPVRRQAIAENYRARRECGEGVTPEQWAAIKEAYAHRCAYCKKKFQRLTQDHVLALSKGGFHVPSNVVPACRSCNSKKHDGPPPFIPPVRILL